eukprot:gene7407-8819_t
MPQVCIVEVNVEWQALHQFKMNVLCVQPSSGCACGATWCLIWAGAGHAGELQESAAQGETCRVQALLKNGALPNACEERDGDDCPPLYLAVAGGHVRTVEVLISFGADVNLGCYKQKTPLHIAVSTDAVELVEILVANGADVNAVDESKLSPAHQAFLRGHQDVLASIMRAPSMDFNLRVGGNNETVLHLSAKEGHEAQVKMILDQDVEAAYARSASNCTALHLAAQAGHQHIVQLLVENGRFDIDALARDNYTPLLFAIRGDHVQTVKFLLGKGASMKARAKASRPLLIAYSGIFSTQSDQVLQNKVEMFKTLLSAGSDPNEQCDEDCNTVLHHFCHSRVYNGNSRGYAAQCMQLLLAHGASKSIRNIKGNTPLETLNICNPKNSHSHIGDHPGHAVFAQH